MQVDYFSGLLSTTIRTTIQQNKNYISKSIRKLDELRKGLCSENFNQYSIVFSRLYSQNEKKNIFDKVTYF